MFSDKSNINWKGIFFNSSYAEFKKIVNNKKFNKIYSLGLYRKQYYLIPDIQDEKELILENIPIKKNNTYLILYSTKNNTEILLDKIKLNNFDRVKEFFKLIGINEHKYREYRQEKYMYNNGIITYNEYPGIKSFIEIHFITKVNIKEELNKYGLSINKVIHADIYDLYSDMLNVDILTLNDIPSINFNNIEDIRNKFIKNDKKQIKELYTVRRRRSKDGTLLVNK
jgi:hypothetical protein